MGEMDFFELNEGPRDFSLTSYSITGASVVVNEREMFAALSCHFRSKGE